MREKNLDLELRDWQCPPGGKRQVLSAGSWVEHWAGLSHQALQAATRICCLPEQPQHRGRMGFSRSTGIITRPEMRGTEGEGHSEAAL